MLDCNPKNRFLALLNKAVNLNGNPIKRFEIQVDSCMKSKNNSRFFESIFYLKMSKTRIEKQ